MLDTILKLAQKAGEMLRGGYYKQHHVEFKDKIDLVTDYDKHIEYFLIEEISKISGDFNIISEELNSGNNFNDNVFIIDPIDGTTNFVHNFPFCAVSIAFYSGKKRYGVVFNPLLNELFYAESNCGAFFNGKQIRVSNEDRLINSLIATGFPYSIVKRDSKILFEMLERVLKNSRGIRRAGSASLDLCYVARSTFQGYYEMSLKPWDVAAGVVILEEAGGVITNLRGDPYSFLDEMIVTSNKFIHQQFLGVLNGQ